MAPDTAPTTPAREHSDAFALAQEAASAEGVPVRTVLRAALSLYVGLPTAARRTIRDVLASNADDVRTAFNEELGFALARAGNAILSRDIIAFGGELGFRDDDASDDDITALALAMVEDSRTNALQSSDEAATQTGPKP